MPTNRPFFANLFSAFRARSSPTFQAKSSGASPGISPCSLVSSAHVSTTAATVTSSPRTINTKASESCNSQVTTTHPTKSAAATSLPFSPNPPSHRYVPPLSRSPRTTSPSPHPNISLSPPGSSTPLTRGRPRRGSNSSNSSGGFMDALGPEKWYIGGRTAGGEETFYRLGVVGAGAGKRVRSLDRLSL